ncbi:hypothetical protein RAS1_22780 [Phycisphaerae bacterium RAS1]|nr:hypothetical protein RAS1_22780 [Phycisphaerae bacterium RAS1]
MTRRLPCLCLALALLGGCAEYTPTGPTYALKKAKLDVDLPPGWLRYRPAKEAYVITRDGLNLARIELVATPVERQTRGLQPFRRGAAPPELADAVLRRFGATSHLAGFHVESVGPARLAGADGFVADAICTAPTGLRQRARLYAVEMNDCVVELRLVAAAQVYFERHAAAFEAVVASLRSEPRPSGSGPRLSEPRP